MSPCPAYAVNFVASLFKSVSVRKNIFDGNDDAEPD